MRSSRLFGHSLLPFLQSRCVTGQIGDHPREHSRPHLLRDRHAGHERHRTGEQPISGSEGAIRPLQQGLAPP